MYVDTTNIEQIFMTRAYLEAPYSTKIDWWMQLAKSLAMDRIDLLLMLDSQG
jgi:hypothetical protein